MQIELTTIDSELLVALPGDGETCLFHGVFADLEDDVDKLEELLADDEVARADRFRFAHLRQKFVICHGWLRRILGQAMGVGPEMLEFKLNRYGKPAIIGSNGVYFNLSHAATGFLVGVTTVGELGVDIECMRNVGRAAQIADRYFCPREAELVTGVDGEARDEVFLQLWTLKEAWIKALGTGLATPLNQADTGHNPAAHGSLLTIDGFSLSLVPEIPAGYVAAVCRGTRGTVYGN